MEEIITGDVCLADPFQVMRAKLEDSIVLTAEKKRVSYSIGLYPGSPGVPSVITCFVGSTNETATKLHAKIVELVRSYFPTPTVSKDSGGEA